MTIVSARTLQDYLAAYLAERGESQAEFSRRSGVSESDISGIMKGRIKFPGPDKRRLLARAMGVSHLDIVVAAGELEPGEVRAVGAEGTVELPPATADLVDRLTKVRLDARRVEALEDILDGWIRRDRKAAEQIADRAGRGG